MRSTAFIPLFALAIGFALSIPLPWIIGGMRRYHDESWPAYRRSYHRQAATYAGLAVVLGAGAAFAFYA